VRAHEIPPLDEARRLTPPERHGHEKGGLDQMISRPKGRAFVERLKLTPAEVFEQLPGFHPSTDVSPLGVSRHRGTSDEPLVYSDGSNVTCSFCPLSFHFVTGVSRRSSSMWLGELKARVPAR